MDSKHIQEEKGSSQAASVGGVRLTAAALCIGLWILADSCSHPVTLPCLLRLIASIFISYSFSLPSSFTPLFPISLPSLSLSFLLSFPSRLSLSHSSSHLPSSFLFPSLHFPPYFFQSDSLPFIFPSHLSPLPSTPSSSCPSTPPQ